MLNMRRSLMLCAVTALMCGSNVFAQEKTLHLAFVTNNASDFWTEAKAGCTKAQSEVPNVEVDFRIPQDGSAATQKRILQDLLARGIDGIAISPKDPENQSDILNEVAGRALLICHDSDAPNSNRACYVGTDNKAAGKQAGEMVKKALPDGGKIMVFVGSMDAQNAKDRFAGLKEELAGSKVTIIDVRTDETDRRRAISNVQDTIVKYPDIAGMVGLWSYNGPAIVNAVRQANKSGQIKVVAFDNEEETVVGIRDGTVYATIVQQPFEFGRQAITLMAKYLRGDKSVVPAGKVIIVPTNAITKDKVDEYWSNLQKTLGKK